MRVGIDASNIRGGGGFTHLSSLIEHARPALAGIEDVVLWTGLGVRERLPDQPWLTKPAVQVLDRGLVARVSWQQVTLPDLLVREGCSVLFSPGGTIPARSTRPAVVMFQNSLPFDNSERAHYPVTSTFRLKLELLLRLQSLSMTRADGVIFLSESARELAESRVIPSRATVVPHGVGERFFTGTRSTREIQECDAANPFRILDVSPVRAYKHHPVIVEAVVNLRNRGLPVVLDIAGWPAEAKAMRELRIAVDKANASGDLVRYLGHVEHSALPDLYASADLLVFASTCENFPNTILEALASGLPVVVAKKGPMQDMIGPAGSTFLPADPVDLEAKLLALILDPGARSTMARDAVGLASRFPWTETAEGTMAFVAAIARDPRRVGRK